MHDGYELENEEIKERVLRQVDELIGFAKLLKENVINKIDTNVCRFNNQFFYGEKVGTYLIDLDDKVVLFDLPTYSREIDLYFHSLNKPLLAILSHGPCGIKDGRIWQKKFGLQVYLHKLDINNEWLELKPDHTFTSPPNIDKSLEVIHTPGHSPGSVCLLHKDTKSLFTGDTFSGNKDGSVRNFLKAPEASGDLQQRLKTCKN